MNAEVAPMAFACVEVERATDGKTHDSGFQAALLKNSRCGLWWDTSFLSSRIFFSCKTRAANKIISKGPSRVDIPPLYVPLRGGKERHIAELSYHGIVLEITPLTSLFSLVLYFISPSQPSLSYQSCCNKTYFSLPTLQWFWLLLR